jgi:hypothetical protein
VIPETGRDTATRTRHSVTIWGGISKTRGQPHILAICGWESDDQRNQDPEVPLTYRSFPTALQRKFKSAGVCLEDVPRLLPNVSWGGNQPSACIHVPSRSGLCTQTLGSFNVKKSKAGGGKDGVCGGRTAATKRIRNQESRRTWATGAAGAAQASARPGAAPGGHGRAGRGASRGRLSTS